MMDAILHDIRNKLGPLFKCEVKYKELPEDGSQAIGMRITTPFTYPDGDNIDVFVFDKDGYYLVTDLGETMRWIRTLNVKLQPDNIVFDLLRDSWDIDLNNGSFGYKYNITQLFYGITHMIQVIIQFTAIVYNTDQETEHG